MVVRKCEENDKDALLVLAKPDKRKAGNDKQNLSAMMYEMMGWNLDVKVIRF